MRVVASVTLGLAIGLMLGWALGLSHTRPITPGEQELAALRWELDTLEGRTRAGLEYCRRIARRLDLQQAALGAGEGPWTR